MVARTPPKQNKLLVALNPFLIRKTLNKVDQCIVRVKELQYTVAGGKMVVSGVNLSPRSTKDYHTNSLSCKQESLRIKHDAPRRSPPGKFPRPTNSEGEEWRQMSLPSMLVGETVGEILQASQFAREIVSAVVSRKTTTNKDPKTPLSQHSNHKVDPENTQLNSRRRKEKQIKPRSDTPPLQGARLKINFKASPPKAREFDKENNNNNNKCYLTNRNRPCARNSNKTVLVPNPLFLSTHSSRQQQFCKTKSPVISRNIGSQQHKFFIKFPPSASKVQVKGKNPPIVSISSSPTRPANLSLNKKSSPKKWVRTFSPSRVTTRLASPLKSKKNVRKSDGVVNLRKSSPTKRSVASKLCRSFSPSRLATRFVSPLKSRKSAQQSHGLVSEVKQRQASTLLIPVPRI